MGPMIMIILFLIALSGSGALGSRAVYRGFSNMNPGKAKIEADFRKVKKELLIERPALVPWSDADRRLLSLKTNPYKEKTGSVKSATGTLISIYHEPMVVFSYKRYIGKKENAILTVLTSHHEYLYRIKKNKVEVAYNGKYFGSISPDFSLLSEKKQVLAHLDFKRNSDYSPLFIGNRNIGGVGNIKQTKKVNPRAFELLSELSPDEEKKLLALAFYFLIRNGFKRI